MPHGMGPAVGMPAATNDVLATWKISTRPSVGFVRYRLESLPLKIASAIRPPNGSGLVTPETTTTVSISPAGASSGPPPLKPWERNGALGISVVLLVESQLRATAPSQAYPLTTIVCGSGDSPCRPRLKWRVTSLKLPAATFTVSNFIRTPLVSTLNPIQEMALGSCARTWMVSSTSTRGAMRCATVGGVLSVATDCMVTVTAALAPRRPAESSANPTMLNVPLAGTTISVSTYSTESASGAVNTMESFGGCVGFVTLVAGDTRNPIFVMPDRCTAITSTGIPLPVEPSAPGDGSTSVTRSACTFDRKMVIVSAAKLPAPSIARPMIVMAPPAPEFAENVMVRATVYVLTSLRNTVSSTPIRPPLNVKSMFFRP